MKKKKTSKLKSFLIYYSQKGAKSELGYIATRAKNISEAKRQAKSTVVFDKKLTPQGAVQKNKFIKSLIFYTKK